MCKKEFRTKTYKTNKNCSKECVIKGLRGSNSPSWKGGIKKDKDRRKSLEMVQWRKEVFKRDDYTCQICQKRGSLIFPHHIFFYSVFPDLRAVVDNGITLCSVCHKMAHTKMPRYFFKHLDISVLKTVIKNNDYRNWFLNLISS